MNLFSFIGVLVVKNNDDIVFWVVTGFVLTVSSLVKCDGV